MKRTLLLKPLLGHSQLVPRMLIALAATLLLFPPNALGADAPFNSSAEDATLRDVCFADQQRGWAVGDRGVIWHTNDGGRIWRAQVSTVTCPLHSVHFVDREHGWAAGGWTEPYSHQSRGVVLRTVDGGTTWQQAPPGALPALQRVRFFDRTHGWAIGHASDLFPAGVFLTQDGGGHWTPLAQGTGTAWQAGDFVDPLAGAVAGQQGAVAAVRRRALEPARSPGYGLRGLKDLRLMPDGHGWLIGDGGLVLSTEDLGASWQLPSGELPALIQHFDLNTIATLGAHTWIAGTPGTRLFYTADGGRTWEVRSTGQSLPIHGMTFVNEQVGWAVGALGTILVTTDSGRSWHPQRRGGTRAAVLGVFSECHDIPLELFASLCGNDAYLGIAEVIGRRHVQQASEAALACQYPWCHGLRGEGCGEHRLAFSAPGCRDQSDTAASAGWLESC